MLSRSERTPTWGSVIRASLPGAELAWLAGAVAAYLITFAVASVSARVWAGAFDTSSSRLGLGGLDSVNVHMQFLAVLVGAAVGAGLSSTRRRKVAAAAGVVSFAVLAVGGVAGTAYSASRATTGNPLHSIATLLLPRTVEAHPIASLQLRDGRDLAEGAEILLIGGNSGEFVVYDPTTRRASGVPKDDFLLLQYGQR